MKRLAVLGSTGSIGTQTLDIVRSHPDDLQIVALACERSVGRALEQAREFNAEVLAIGSTDVSLEAFDVPNGLQVEFGHQAVVDLVKLPEVDIVVNSLVGAAGLEASYEVLKAGKILALANKESLVVGGDLIMPLARELDDRIRSLPGAPVHGPAGALMPIDSEHGAIYQCLIGEDAREVSRLWVTASGGPFRGKTKEELRTITAEQALKHPTWNMGAKITIDSSTLMNKGLEVIEAHHLFDMPYERIKVVVQPQSAIHSMVEFVDGSVKAHLGTTDMRIPIQYALSYPQRWDTPVQPLDFTQIGSLDFEAPDTRTFRCLVLARQAGERGGTLPCVMNAANEIAVAAFLEGACSYLGIADCVEAVMNAHVPQSVQSIEQLLEIDAWARKQARMWLSAQKFRVIDKM